MYGTMLLFVRGEQGKQESDKNNNNVRKRSDKNNNNGNNNVWYDSGFCL